MPSSDFFSGLIKGKKNAVIQSTGVKKVEIKGTSVQTIQGLYDLFSRHKFQLLFSYNSLAGFLICPGCRLIDHNQ